MPHRRELIDRLNSTRKQEVKQLQPLAQEESRIREAVLGRKLCGLLFQSKSFHQTLGI